MNIENKELREQFRSARRCELCHKPTPGGCEPHHLFRKGMGGGQWLDIEINLASLCLWCHNYVHSKGRWVFLKVLIIVARREGWEPHAMLDELHRLRRITR